MAIGMTMGSKPVAGDEEEDQANHLMTFAAVKMVMMAAIGGFLFGYDTGIVSGAMVYIRDDFGLDDIWQEVIISITILSAWIFSIIAGSLSDKFGRKKTVVISSIVFTIGSLMMGFAPDVWTLLAGRFVVGAGVGLSSMIIPLYIAELAPSRIRGTLVTFNNLFITGGQAISALVAVAFSFVPESLGWRFMLGIGCVPSIIQFLGFLTLPESPRWLIREGREEEAYIVLQTMRGSAACVDKEFARILANCKNNGRQEVANQSPSTSRVADDQAYEKNSFWSTFSEVWNDKYLSRALSVGCMLQAIQQLTGINTVMYYSATIIQMSGVADKSTAVWMASVTAMVNFLTTFIGIFAVDRIGRRKLTLISLSGVILSLGILAAGFTIETMYSPSVGRFPSRDPLDVICAQKQDCESCIISSECGFCYDPGNASNGSCVSSDPDKPFTSSAAGSCHYSVNMTEKKRTDHPYQWTYGYCPAPYSFVVLLGLCVYLLAFGPGMGPMPWTINSEIYPLWARTTCCSITTSVNWFFNMLISLTFLTLVRHITKEGTFLLYTVFGIIGFIYFYKYLPETKGKNLEETHAMFRRKSVVRVYTISDKEGTHKKVTNRLSGGTNPQLIRTESSH